MSQAKILSMSWIPAVELTPVMGTCDLLALFYKNS